MFNSTSISMQKSEKLKCLISFPFNYPNFQKCIRPIEFFKSQMAKQSQVIY